MSSKKSAGKGEVEETELPVSPETLKEMYRQMVLIRHFEQVCGQQYQQKKFSGFCHLYIGQEAVAVGTLAAMKYGTDYLFQTYRDHAHALIMGIPAREVMAELFMKTEGCSRGKGGSMHMFNAKDRFMGGNGIVGGHTPLATGVAFASKYRKDGAVTIVKMGDAAVNQGTFHESLNMAGIWNLPIVYVVENNIYGMGTSVTRSCAQPELYKRSGDAYRIEGVQVNGMDAIEVYKVMKAAIDKARNESRPTFVEMVTYRYRGHSMSDPAVTYRNKDEVSQWQMKDPIDRMKAQFPEVITEDFIKSVDEAVKAEVKESVEYAENGTYPELSELWTHVYVDCEGYTKKSEEVPNKYAFPYDQFGPRIN